jgi:hypothetical protein
MTSTTTSPVPRLLSPRTASLGLETSSSPLDRLQRRLANLGGGGTLTEERLGSDAVVSHEIVKRIIASLRRQETTVGSPQEMVTRDESGGGGPGTPKQKSRFYIPKGSSRTFVVPCIFDGHRTSFQHHAGDDASTQQNKKEKKLGSLIDGIISFQALLQHFHEDLFEALRKFEEEIEQEKASHIDPSTQPPNDQPQILSSPTAEANLLQSGTLDSEGEANGKPPNVPNTYVSMACVHLKERRGDLQHSRDLWEERDDDDEVVVTHAYDLTSEDGVRPCRPELHYNNPFLDPTVESLHHVARSDSSSFIPEDPSGGTPPTAANGFLVPRWSCGAFNPVSNQFSADGLLSASLQAFHQHLTDIYQEEGSRSSSGYPLPPAAAHDRRDSLASDPSGSFNLASSGSGPTLHRRRGTGSEAHSFRYHELSSETMMVEYCLMRNCPTKAGEEDNLDEAANVQDGNRDGEIATTSDRQRANGSSSTGKEGPRLYTTVVYFVLTSTAGSFISGLRHYKPSHVHAPAATKGRSQLILEAMQRALISASASFWHPILDEVIVHNVGSLTAVGATEGECGEIAPATHTALGLIRATLQNEQRKLMKQYRDALRAGSSTSGFGALWCRSPPAGNASEQVLAKAHIALALAASMYSPYHWLCSLLHPDWNLGDATSGVFDYDPYLNQNELLGATIDSALLLEGTFRAQRGQQGKGKRLDELEDAPSPAAMAPQPTPQKSGKGDGEDASALRPSCPPMDTSSTFIVFERGEQTDLPAELPKDDRDALIASLQKDNEELLAYIHALKSTGEENETRLLEESEALAELRDERDSLLKRLRLYEQMTSLSQENMLAERSRALTAQEEAELARKASQRKNATNEILVQTDPLPPPPPPPSPTRTVIVRVPTRDDDTQTDSVPVAENCEAEMNTEAVALLDVELQTEEMVSSDAVRLSSRGTSPVPIPGPVVLNRGSSPIPQPVIPTMEIGCQVSDLDSLDTSALRQQLLEEAKRAVQREAEFAKRAMELEGTIQQLRSELLQTTNNLEVTKRTADQQRAADASLIEELTAANAQLQGDKKKMLQSLRGLQQARQDELEIQSRASSVNQDDQLADKLAEEKGKVKEIVSTMQLELSRLKRQIEELELALKDAKSKNHTMAKLISIYEGGPPPKSGPGGSGGSSGGSQMMMHEGHYAGHCSHPHPHTALVLSPFRESTGSQPEAPTHNGIRLIQSRNPTASNQLSCVSPPRTNSPNPRSGSAGGRGPSVSFDLDRESLSTTRSHLDDFAPNGSNGATKADSQLSAVVAVPSSNSTASIGRASGGNQRDPVLGSARTKLATTAVTTVDSRQRLAKRYGQ